MYQYNTYSAQKKRRQNEEGRNPRDYKGQLLHDGKKKSIRRDAIHLASKAYKEKGAGGLHYQNRGIKEVPVRTASSMRAKWVRVIYEDGNLEDALLSSLMRMRKKRKHRRLLNAIAPRTNSYNDKVLEKYLRSEVRRRISLL